MHTYSLYYALPLIGGVIKRSCCLTSVCLSVTYIGPKSRTETHRKTKIGTEVANVTRDSDTTFKVRRSKANLFDGQKRPSLRPYSAALLCFDSVGTNLV